MATTAPNKPLLHREPYSGIAFISLFTLSFTASYYITVWAMNHLLMGGL